MRGKFQLWFLPALALGLGVYGLTEVFVKGSQLSANPKRIHPTLTALRHSGANAESDSAFQAAVKADSLPPRSPFGNPVPPRPVQSATTSKPAWIRPILTLKGTVGTQAATLVNAQGEKQIVRVGDYLDSILVLRIQPGQVTLRDSHGTFEISAQE